MVEYTTLLLMFFKFLINNIDALTIDETQSWTGYDRNLINPNYNAITNTPDLSAYATNTIEIVIENCQWPYNV